MQNIDTDTTQDYELTDLDKKVKRELKSIIRNKGELSPEQESVKFEIEFKELITSSESVKRAIIESNKESNDELEDHLRKHIPNSTILLSRLQDQFKHSDKSITKQYKLYINELINSESVGTVRSLLPILDKITSEMDAQEYVRIYLDAINAEDRELIYDILGSFFTHFKNIFVARMLLTQDDFNIHNGSIKLGGNTIPNLVKKNNYHGVLYSNGEVFYIPTSSFVPKNGTAAIPNGRKIVSDIQERSYAGEQICGILEIRTEKYQEPEPLIRRVELGKRGSSPKTAVVNTQLFPTE
jgi:hypothetical protein